MDVFHEMKADFDLRWQLGCRQGVWLYGFALKLEACPKAEHEMSLCEVTEPKIHIWGSASWKRIKCPQLVRLPVCFHHFKPFFISSQCAGLFQAQQASEKKKTRKVKMLARWDFLLYVPIFFFTAKPKKIVENLLVGTVMQLLVCC